MANIRRAIRVALRTLDEFLGLRRWLAEGEKSVSFHRLEGEKLLDWAWVISNLPSPPAKVLDIGCNEAPLMPILHELGYDVVGIDAVEQMPYVLPDMKYVRGDFLNTEFEPHEFDVVILCSVVEHIGLAGRYGCVREEPDGDLRAMRKVYSLLRADGHLLLTIPVGIFGVYSPYHRVYSEERLSGLLSGFTILRERYFARDYPRPWQEVKRAIAFSMPSSAEMYALGEFVLKKGLRVQ